MNTIATIKKLTLSLAIATLGTFTSAQGAQIDMQSLGHSIPSAPAKATIPNTAHNANTSPTNISIQRISDDTTQTGIGSSSPNAPAEVGPAHYDGHLVNFPTRKVTLVIPTVLRNENTAAFGKYLSTSISNVLRYPYYDTTMVSTNTPLQNITAVDFSQIAAAQQSEIVIMPVPMQDTYVQLPLTYLNQYYSDDSDDIHIKANISAMVYYYDTSEGVVHTIRSGFNQIDDSLTMPTHKSIWNKIVKELLEKLPYKRVPSDRDRYRSPGVNAESPIVTDYQVEQPKNTAYSLQGVSVL